MADRRSRVARGLMAIALGLGTGRAVSAAPVEVRYVCPRAQTLVVTRSAKFATARFIGRTYKLRRVRSSIGIRYISGTAALIVDGRSAVFVAEDRLHLGTCVERDRPAPR